LVTKRATPKSTIAASCADQQRIADIVPGDGSARLIGIFHNAVDFDVRHSLISAGGSCRLGTATQNVNGCSAVRVRCQMWSVRKLYLSSVAWPDHFPRNLDKAFSPAGGAPRLYRDESVESLRKIQ
jgi:hypothetical protein